ncbi:MAG: hypothetical protein HWD61_14570 [Parachlamydiaceae bacterium]|nr:MAG: hypothetical protein HWD61_14570 [Parachlamydiaceae bacterium]
MMTAITSKNMIDSSHIENINLTSAAPINPVQVMKTFKEHTHDVLALEYLKDGIF